MNRVRPITPGRETSNPESNDMPNGFLHRHFIVRQVARSRRQAMVFLLCVALSIITLVSLNGFSASVNSSMLNDAKTLHAADIIIESYFDLSPSVVNVVEQLENQNRSDTAEHKAIGLTWIK